jgi:hypothetical protein
MTLCNNLNLHNREAEWRAEKFQVHDPTSLGVCISFVAVSAETADSMWCA